MTRRERVVRERVIAAALAIVELERTFGCAPLSVLQELASASRALYQIAIAKGRKT